MHPATATQTRTLSIRLLASLALLSCASAQAQPVHKCQVDGRVVFQSSPCAIEAHIASTPQASAAAEAPAPPKKKSLADLLRERGDGRGRPPEREPRGDGADVLRSRMGAV